MKRLLENWSHTELTHDETLALWISIGAAITAALLAATA